MKNLDSDFVKEYYNRKSRRHPLWKSEAEYKAIFDEGYSQKIFEIVVNGLEGLCKYLNFVCKSQEINDDTLNACKKDIEDAEKLKMASSNETNMERTIAEKRKHMQWMYLRRKCMRKLKLCTNIRV